MNRQNLGFLLGGLAFGILIGYGTFNAIQQQPDLDAAQPSNAGIVAPRGPAAPTGGSGAGPAAAPMMARVRALRERVETNPQDADALVELANLYHDASMFDEAIDFYDQALGIRPGDPNLLTDLGTCYRNQGKPDRALELFSEASQADPTHWQSLFNTVIVAGFELRRFDEAEAALIRLESLDPKPPRIEELRAEFDRIRAGSA